MRPVLIFVWLAGVLQAQKLAEDDAKALIEKARRNALNYTASLPDFLCTQTVQRYEDPKSDNRWSRIDVLTVKLSYSERREDYKLIAINGKPTQLDYLDTNGATSKGEFGSVLLYLFHPKMATEFRWKGWTTIQKRKAAVFSYKVDQAHTQFHVTFGKPDDGQRDIAAPYYGEVVVDGETAEILRISQHAVLPVGFPIKESASTVEYGYEEVGGKRYLLPVHAEVIMAAGRYKSRNRVEFREYRKFSTETVITFDK